MLLYEVIHVMVFSMQSLSICYRKGSKKPRRARAPPLPDYVAMALAWRWDAFDI